MTRGIVLSLLVSLAGCSSTQDVFDASSPKEAASSDLIAPESGGAVDDSGSPDAQHFDASPRLDIVSPDVAAAESDAGTGSDSEADAPSVDGPGPAWVPPATCAGLKLNNDGGPPPLAVFEGTPIMARLGGSFATCEGDLFVTFVVSRTLCGSVPQDPTVIADYFKPGLQPVPAETALFAVGPASCPRYDAGTFLEITHKLCVQGPCYDAWNTLAAMLRPDGGP